MPVQGNEYKDRVLMTTINCRCRLGLQRTKTTGSKPDVQLETDGFKIPS